MTNYDWAAIAQDDSAPAALKLLAALAPQHETVLQVVEQFKAINDLDEAVAAHVANSTAEEDVKARETIEKAKRAIEKLTAEMEERARTVLVANIDPNFDEQKAKARYTDAKVALKSSASSVRDVFKLLGHVSSEISEAGREGNFKANDEYGELLLSFMDVPKLSGKESAGGASEEVREFNRNAKEWGRQQGMKVADKGALSTEVKEAYAKHMGIEIPTSK